MFTLTLSSYFGSPGESWLHINVVINWQLSKQGIRWPVSPDRIAGSGVDPSRSSIFWSYPLTIYSFSNDRRLTFTFVLNSQQICCVYVSIAPHYYDFDFKLTSDAKIQPVFLKYRRGRPFLTMVTCWSRSTSNFYAQGPVARSMVSANRWLRGIKRYRFPWYLTMVSTNHASSNPGLIG